MRGRSWLLTVGAFGMAVLAWSQPASMVLRLDNAQLVSRSHLVVHGRVTAVKPGGKTMEALVAVECPLKGAPGKEVTVIFSPGLSESPVFEPGEVVLLFLTESEPGRFQTTGRRAGQVLPRQEVIPMRESLLTI